MANLIQVTPEEMVRKAQNLDQKITEWGQTVQSIYNLVEELDAMWDGLANSAFNVNFKEDLPHYNQLGEMMSEYSNAIKEAAKRYVDGEQQVAEIIKRRN